MGMEKNVETRNKEMDFARSVLQYDLINSKKSLLVGMHCYQPCTSIVAHYSVSCLNHIFPIPGACVPPDSLVPETSYSSSEDEDFFDADDFASTTPSQSPRLVMNVFMQGKKEREKNTFCKYFPIM